MGQLDCCKKKEFDKSLITYKLSIYPPQKERIKKRKHVLSTFVYLLVQAPWWTAAPGVVVILT